MSSEFYDLYKSYEQPELFDVLLNPNDYQPEAIECAKQVLKEKRWAADYQKAQDAKKEEQQQADVAEQEDITEKAEYYRKAVEIKMQHNGYSVLLNDIPKFEAKLAELKLDYFTDQQPDILQSFVANSQTYYFKNEDTNTVDGICKEMGITSSQYTIERMSMGLQLKVIGVVLVGGLIVYGVYYLLNR